MSTPSSPRALAEPLVVCRSITRSTVVGSTDEYVDEPPEKRASPNDVAEATATPGTVATTPATCGLNPSACVLEDAMKRSADVELDRMVPNDAFNDAANTPMLMTR